MTSFKQEYSTEPPPTSQSGCVDPLDIDRYINFDQTVLPTPSISPLSFRSKSVTTPTSSTANANVLFPTQPSPQTFSGPSHQYEQYKQQTGLPVGALANTIAINQADQFGYGRGQQAYGMMPPSDGYLGMNDDCLDFNAFPSQSPSGEMDFDFGSPVQDMSIPNTDFVNPAAIGGQESTSHAHPVRVYPGMHQQAALAKAQAQQQQQQAQQAKAQQQQSMPPAHSRQSSRSQSNARPPTDPIVEQSISRLLDRMRHSSVASSNDDDDAATPNANGGSQHTGRSRKDEEDMDEDERLLASEEGKKLSSKERRQLRNKVSARAFRSRRKEYIGQLEGEIAAKSTEADELRVKNEELMAENTRLTDLTRMLLSSPAFSTFLNDLSGTGARNSLPEQSQTQTPTPTPRPQSSTTRKDVNPNHVTPRQSQGSAQNNAHVGMTLIPEESEIGNEFHFSGATGYNGIITENMDFGLYDAQVFAVTSIPDGPAIDSIDIAMLQGKSSNAVSPYHAADDGKDEPAAIEAMPCAQEKVEMPELVASVSEDSDLDVLDPAFALYVDQPSTPKLVVVEPEDRIFGEIELEKAFGRLEIIVDENANNEEVNSATIERFERLCSRLDAASERVAAVTAHL